jgi:protein required for attachment to host cells
MSTVWVLVCDSAKARFFEAHDGEASWSLVSETFHEESRSKAAALVGDRSGSRSSEGATVHHNALAPASSPKEVQKEHFAHELGQVLDQAMRSSRLHSWVLVAPPHFAGLIEKELTPALEKSLLAKVCKDLSHLDAKELKEKLRDSIRVPPEKQDSARH